MAIAILPRRRGWADGALGVMEDEMSDPDDVFVDLDWLRAPAEWDQAKLDRLLAAYAPLDDKDWDAECNDPWDDILRAIGEPPRK